MDKVTIEKKNVEEAVLEALQILGAKREDVIVNVLDEGQKGFLGLIGGKNAVVTVVKKDSEEAIGLVDNENEVSTDSVVQNKVEEAKEFLTSSVDKIKDKVEEAELDDKVQDIKDEVKEEFEDIKDEVKEEFEDIKSRAEEKAADMKQDFEQFGRKHIISQREKFKDPTEAAEKSREFCEEIIKKMGYGVTVEVIEPADDDDNYVLDIILDDYKLNSRIIGKKGDTLSSIGYLINVYLRNHYDENMMIEVDCGDYIYEKQEDLRAFARIGAERALNEGIFKMRPMTAYERRIVHKELSDYDGVSTHSEGEEPKRRIVITRDPQ